MSDTGRFSVTGRVRSFRDAFRGVAILAKTQHNARIHGFATVAVIAAGFWLGCGAGEWAVLALAIALVWLAEGMNTAIEALGDAVSPESHPLVGRAKDVAAGAVLLAAIGAAVAGLLVFVPRLLARFGA
ncbi:MAG: diacylglycerol kinase family protein [Myxococcota bacterium]|nr:diacylglycerol kinase family protein [Myxococcota bacterium]